MSTWSDRAWQVMGEGRAECLLAGKTPPEIVKAIDDAYPFGPRSHWPYKAWLKARKQFFDKHGLPRKGQRSQQEMLNDLVGQMQKERGWKA